MLQITLPEREFFNEATGEFINTKAVTLKLEHSLVSLSRWESKWKKPFLSNKDPLNREEWIDYVRCMTINQGVDPETYRYLGVKELKEIQDYIGDSHTATKIYDHRTTTTHRQETITSELIYYWMVYYDIPSEYEKWHLNRLLTLIKICNVKNSPDRKMSRQSIYAQNKELNAMRRAKLHSRG